MTALALHMTHNHVCAQNCVSLADVHTHAAWYLSRSVPVAMQSNMLRRYCKEYGFGQPTWDGELKGETATGAIGRKLVATFLVQEGCEEVTADVGTVVAVRPHVGILVSFRDGQVTINDEDDWEWVRTNAVSPCNE